MPTYDYKCPECGHESERVCKIAERNDQYCECCMTQMKQVHKAPNNANIFFKEGWYEHIDFDPIYISSMKQLKDETSKRGQTSVYAEDSLCLK